MVSPAALTSSATNEHYTPPEIIAAARYTLGEIDLDPASCARANTVVKARAFCHRDGLDADWDFEQAPARVWLNPPGGKSDPKTLDPLPRDADGKQNGPGISTPAVWWWKLLYELRAGHVKAACFDCFSLDLFQSAQHPKGEGVSPPYMFPLCVPAQRSRHWSETTPIGKGSPSQPGGVVLVLNESLLGRAGVDNCRDRFVEAFSPLGAVRL